MTKSKTSAAKFDPLGAALAKINAALGGTQAETEKSILAYAVYEGERVVVVISTGQKFTIAWEALTPPLRRGAGDDEASRAELPDTTLNR